MKPLSARQASFYALTGIPEVAKGDDIAAIIQRALTNNDLTLTDNDIIVVSQKIVSKAEGRVAHLQDVVPTAKAHELARQTDKDPRLIELILSESVAVLRARPGLIIVEHRLGLVMANAGIDHSNLALTEDDTVLLLPKDPDASARLIGQRLEDVYQCRIAVLVVDSVGRAWRQGVVGLAIGASGLQALVDLRGTPDRSGRLLGVTQVGFADQLASAASLLMGEAAEGCPVVVARGLTFNDADVDDAGANALVRPAEHDLFR